MKPLAFVVEGIPAVPGSAKPKREAWRAAVQLAAREAYGERAAPIDRSLAVAFVYFHVGAAKPDIDNVAKKLFDSLKGVLFSDDSLVVEMIARRTEIVPGLALDDPPAPLAAALAAETANFVYVEVRDPPDPRRLP
ncbi:MAG: RusA family crossover junction endodeoxyribonuclease [Alphaproteobacteria bacterium]|nr:RusA family crossover junction endodeoxyribonuclease [Alphaproteobacteria bacterium]